MISTSEESSRYDRNRTSSAFITEEDALAELRAVVGTHRTRSRRRRGRRRRRGFLSGGIDSTLTAFLAAEALGSDRVLDHTAEPEGPPAGRDGCEDHRRRHRHRVRGDTAVAVRRGRRVGDIRRDRRRGDTVVGGNLVARLRMAALYYVANVQSRLVVGTANRSELLTGYFTKHGDGAADLYPMGDLYKTEVRALARQASASRDVSSPRSRPPGSGAARPTSPNSAHPTKSSTRCSSGSSTRERASRRPPRNSTSTARWPMSYSPATSTRSTSARRPRYIHSRRQAVGVAPDSEPDH